MRAVALVLVLAATAARADDTPYTLGAAVGSRLTLFDIDAMLVQTAVVGSRRFGDRWHAGARVQADRGDVVWIVEGAVEGGVWLHASRRIDVLLGWRFGFARMMFDWATVNATVVEPVAELGFALTPRLELRFAPLVVTGYRSGVWQLTLGPAVTVGWRL